jgi:hypothetical protein
MLAENHLFAWFMQAPHEDKFAAMRRVVRPDPGPTRDDLRKICDVGLTITP